MRTSDRLPEECREEIRAEIANPKVALEYMEPDVFIYALKWVLNEEE